jgi:DNA-binding transcriptional MocR family regulator
MLKILIDKSSNTPLYAQIRDALQAAIQSGQLKPGDKIPPVTVFAKDVGVTQATIRRALEDLTKSGIIMSHVGRGTFVSDPAQKTKAKSNTQDLNLGGKSTDPEATLAARRLRMGIEKSLNDLLALAKRPGLIQFTSGVPDPGLLKDGLIKDLLQDALKAEQKTFQEYGDPLGMPELRAEIALRYGREGVQVSPDQVLITNGSQQALALLAQNALENEYRVICETPCYLGVTNAFGAFGHWIETVIRDQDGPLPDRLDRFRDGRSSFFYLCPELHNPMGTDLSLERRHLITDWAKEQQSVLIADEIFRDLRFEGPALPSLFTLAGDSNTVIIGSLSKSFMAGLRIGWLITSPERVRSLVTLKRAMDIACPPLMQSLALSLLRTKAYDVHLQKAREHYRLRRDSVLRALTQYMPQGVSWTKPQGSFHMWLELPPGYSSIALFLLAIERGVAFIPGPMQDINHRFIHTLRLGYGSVEPQQIKEGIEQLAEAVKELLKEPPGSDLGLSGLGDFQ